MKTNTVNLQFCIGCYMLPGFQKVKLKRKSAAWKFIIKKALRQEIASVMD
ncbi:MAG: hypothetical protein QM764_04620 [Chitinophagaceae bacterium]